jgi:hypothetical protein
LRGHRFIWAVDLSACSTEANSFQESVSSHASNLRSRVRDVHVERLEGRGEIYRGIRGVSRSVRLDTLCGRQSLCGDSSSDYQRQDRTIRDNQTIHFFKLKLALLSLWLIRLIYNSRPVCYIGLFAERLVFQVGQFAGLACLLTSYYRYKMSRRVFESYMGYVA